MSDAKPKGPYTKLLAGDLATIVTARSTMVLDVISVDEYGVTGYDDDARDNGANGEWTAHLIPWDAILLMSWKVGR